MSTNSKDALQGDIVYDLPYRLIPEVGNESHLSFAPPAAEKYLRGLTVPVLTTVVALWTVLFIYFDSQTEVPKGFTSIILYNLVAYGFMRLALVPKKAFIFGGAGVGLLWLLSNLQGLNTLVLFLLLAACAAKSYFIFQALPRYTSTQAAATEALASIPECKVPQWGVPGGNIAEAQQFGTAGEAGAKGERIVGRALESLVGEYPFIRVFHGVKFVPFSSQKWDVDHVVVIGSTVYFVDAKYWSFGAYEWMGPEELWRDGAPFKGGEVHMASAVEKWLPYVKNFATLQARITLAKKETDNYFYVCDNSRAAGVTHVCSLHVLLQELRAVARQTEPLVDRRLVRLFMEQRHGFTPGR